MYGDTSLKNGRDMEEWIDRLQDIYTSTILECLDNFRTVIYTVLSKMWKTTEEQHPVHSSLSSDLNKHKSPPTKINALTQMNTHVEP